MKISLVFFTMLAICVALPVGAQTQSGAGPMKFSLNEAKNYALNNSPVLLNSARDVEIAKKKIWESTATGLPQASLSGSYSYSPQISGLIDVIKNYFTGFENMNINDFKTNFYANIQVSQLIFSGQYIVGLKASKVYASLSELANSKSIIGITESITTTYFTALIAVESRDILDSTLIIVQKTLFQTEQLHANGFAESTDVDQLKILKSNIKINLSVAIRQIDLMERLLKFQMGIPIDQAIVLTDKIDPLVNTMNLETAVLDSFKINNNVDYQILITQEKLMKLNMQAQKVQYLPTLAGYYNRYEDFDNNTFNDQSPDLFGLSLNFPLWTSGQRNSQVSQKQIEYLKAKTNREMAAEDILIQYETTLSDYLSARDIYGMQQESRMLALHIYEKSLEKFTQGMGSSLDLNQTQSQYFDEEVKYFNALMSLVSAKAKLESLLANSAN